MLVSFEYHIVRILRNGPEDSDVFEGIVERAGEKGARTFKNFEELKEILDSKRLDDKKRSDVADDFEKTRKPMEIVIIV